MSQSDFNAIIRRAWQDPVFRNLLLNDPKAAFHSYELTFSELRILLELDETSLSELHSTLADEDGNSSYDNSHLENENDVRDADTFDWLFEEYAIEDENQNYYEDENDSRDHEAFDDGLAGEEGEGDGPID